MDISERKRVELIIEDPTYYEKNSTKNAEEGKPKTIHITGIVIYEDKDHLKLSCFFDTSKHDQEHDGYFIPKGSIKKIIVLEPKVRPS